jgi:hypothetical protein
MGVCKGAGTRVLTTSMADAFIDDFEEAVISPGWSSFSDVPGMLNVAQIMLATPGAATTAHAGHYSGSGAIISTMNGYGVGTVYNTAINPAIGQFCVDIAAFDGVAFWAKAATAQSISLNFVLPETNAVSEVDGGMNTGGDCVGTGTGHVGCFNHPSITFALTTEFKQYTAPFASATPGTVPGGMPISVGSVIQELAFLSPGADWDFTIDEIAFYKGTPPTGPVGNCTIDNTCDGG